MEKINEYIIEQFVRYPDEFTVSERAQIKEFIAKNEESRRIADWYKEFYDQLNIVNRPVLLKLKNKKFTAKYSGPMVLAAMTSPEMNSGIVTKATFASEEQNTLVRILEDRRSKKLQFHVLSKFIGEKDRVLIGFEGLGFEFVTDKGGKLKDIEVQELSNLNWQETMLLLRLSSSTCHYEPGDSLNVCDDCNLSVNDGICMLQLSNDSISRILVEQNDEIKIFNVEGDVFSFEIDDGKAFTVYLYK